MIHIGFTGTRHGMTDKQRDRVWILLIEQTYGDRAFTFHHGDCVGADAECHRLVREMSARIERPLDIEKHPPSNTASQAHCLMMLGEVTHWPLPYMARNAAIVAAADLVLATPFEMREQDRGGTWGTIGIARRVNRPLVIVFPDGTTEGEWP